MNEQNLERVAWLLQFEPKSLADKTYLESELVSEIEICEREKRVSDALRLKRKLASLRGVKLPPEPQKTDEQRKLDSEIERCEREGRWSEAIRLKRRRFLG